MCRQERLCSSQWADPELFLTRARKALRTYGDSPWDFCSSRRLNPTLWIKSQSSSYLAWPSGLCVLSSVWDPSMLLLSTCCILSLKLLPVESNLIIWISLQTHWVLSGNLGWKVLRHFSLLFQFWYILFAFIWLQKSSQVQNVQWVGAKSTVLHKCNTNKKYIHIFSFQAAQLCPHPEYMSIWVCQMMALTEPSFNGLWKTPQLNSSMLKLDSVIPIFNS